MMDSEINYSKLTSNELKVLILADDIGALEEYTKRIRSGEITPKTYSTNEAGKIVSKNLQFQVDSKQVNYKNLTNRELRHLLRVDDAKAYKEYDRRVKTGKIKPRKVSLEDIRKMYAR